MAPGTGKTIAYGKTGHIEFISAVASEKLRAVTRNKSIQLMITQICHSAYALGRSNTLKLDVLVHCIIKINTIGFCVDLHGATAHSFRR